MNVRMAVLASAVLCTAAAAAAAQSIPRLVLSVEQGNGPHTMQSGETYFRQAHSTTAMVAATVRMGRWGRLAPVIRLERETSPRFDFTSDCPRAPNNTCKEFFRQPDGWGVAIGGFGGVTRWLSLGGLAGQQRPGGYVQNFAEVRGHLTPLKWFGITGAIRNLVWDDPTYGRMWHRLYISGLQVQLP